MATETLMMTDRLVLSPETGAGPPIGASVSESSPPILLQEPPHEVNEFSLSAADGGALKNLFRVKLS